MQYTLSSLPFSCSEDIVKKFYEKSVRFSQLHCAPGGVDIPPNVVSMATFKLFLSRMLGQCDPTVQDSAIRGSGPLLLYNPQVGACGQITTENWF